MRDKNVIEFFHSGETNVKENIFNNVVSSLLLIIDWPDVIGDM